MGFPRNQCWIMCRWCPEYHWGPPEHPRDTSHAFSASCLRLPIRPVHSQGALEVLGRTVTSAPQCCSEIGMLHGSKSFGIKCIAPTGTQQGVFSLKTLWNGPPEKQHAADQSSSFTQFVYSNNHNHTRQPQAIATSHTVLLGWQCNT